MAPRRGIPLGMGTLSNEPANLIRWIMDPRAIEPGTAMPDVGVTEAVVRDMLAYLCRYRRRRWRMGRFGCDNEGG